MSDETLTIAAVALGLGVPLGVLFLCWQLDLGPKLIVVLAGLTPALVFYVEVTVAYVANPTEPNNRFAFFAGWSMTLAAYMAVLVVGIALSFSAQAITPVRPLPVGSVALDCSSGIPAAMTQAPPNTSFERTREG